MKCAMCYEECLYDVEVGEYDDDVAQLECTHIFHKDCLRGCFKPVCPLCNAPHHKVTVMGTLPSHDEKVSNHSPEVLIDAGWFTNLTSSVYIQPDALLALNHSRTVVSYDDV